MIASCTQKSLLRRGIVKLLECDQRQKSREDQYACEDSRVDGNITSGKSPTKEYLEVFRDGTVTFRSVVGPNRLISTVQIIIEGGTRRREDGPGVVLELGRHHPFIHIAPRCYPVRRLPESGEVLRPNDQPRKEVVHANQYRTQNSRCRHSPDQTHETLAKVRVDADVECEESPERRKLAEVHGESDGEVEHAAEECTRDEYEGHFSSFQGNG
mmetsp:Transcript_2755/g.4966  ORF Transcript_2755/g.4966 Transcript_2755/m.4966 type:complete len:213 (+) Transcript_2755:95-733(+)